MLTKMNADIEKPELDVITADNHPTIQRKRAKTMDFTSLAKRPVKGSSISLQLKIAVFQFLSTSFRCELFTLATRGTVTLESDIEHIISTVGPFISFAATTLLTAKENTNTYDPSSPFAFEKLDSSDIDDHDNSNKQEQTSSHGDHSSEKHQPSIVAIVCNPILLNLSSNEQSSKNRLNQQNCNSSSTSSNVNDEVTSPTMDIDRMFGDKHDKYEYIFMCIYFSVFFLFSFTISMIPYEIMQK
ncbi:unnamed protein product [Rotaria socialis]|uniref:Uncharacterized protein n=1 Tax=Rotaria socialis TaxID=392032 RepID=A0A817ZQN3_9BILA|nr:unnamed protein product [Rotaria socialis]